MFAVLVTTPNGYPNRTIGPYRLYMDAVESMLVLRAEQEGSAFPMGYQVLTLSDR